MTKLIKAKIIPIPFLTVKGSPRKMQERATVKAGYNAVRVVVCPTYPPLRNAYENPKVPMHINREPIKV
jgi:hypothetical protein